MRKTKNLLVIGLACCASFSFVSLSACKGAKYNSFESFYEETCADNKGWAKLSADGKTLSMDTRPYDGYYIEQGWPDLDVYESEVLDAIGILHQDYKIASYVYEQLLTTTAADGKQKYEDKNMVIFWTFSKTNGLEITYGLK